MGKRPSEWTPQEAWAKGVQEAILALGPMPSMVHSKEWLQRCAFPYPSDPPERVSDKALEDYSGAHGRNREISLMALELIERRRAEKEGKG